MQRAILLNANDVKEIIAEKFNVPTKNVIKSQYSFTVIREEDEGGENDENSGQTV